MFLLALCIKPVLSQGNLLITPVRVVFQDTKSREDLNITNIGNDSSVFVISFLHYLMRNDGSFIEVAKGDSSTYADKYLRIYPRRIKLGPNESQTIRLQFRKPAVLNDGEYRTHIFFRAEKNLSILGMRDPNADSTKMAVKITPIFGISIPVIVRSGNLSNNIHLSEIKMNNINDSISRLSFSIFRDGNRSSYGNVVVSFQQQGGKQVEIARSNGVGVYTEINYRNMIMQIPFNKNLYRNGKLMVRYMSPPEEGNIVYGSSELVIP